MWIVRLELMEKAYLLFYLAAATGRANSAEQWGEYNEP
jgi:hypothetical protein